MGRSHLSSDVSPPTASIETDRLLAFALTELGPVGGCLSSHINEYAVIFELKV